MNLSGITYKGFSIFRKDIQGLRGMAVALVVIFHVWPNVLRGGYVGVDIFFVISGYLITAILIGEIIDHGSINLLRFYAHRLARLVPAATIALVACGLLTLAFFPSTRWRDTGIDIVASASYLENWVLARRSVNYLNAYSSPSIAQHFWSLSVEGQFYVIWPLALLAINWARRLLPARWALSWQLVLSSLTIVLFAVSLELFRRNPGLAYFSSFTRFWEMTLGGSVAFLARPTNPASSSLLAPLRAIAVLSMLAAAAFFDNTTPFPGLPALLPTLGAAAFLYSGSGRGGESGFFCSRPMVYLGDISYSVYLWHWPLLISVTDIFGEPLTPFSKFFLVAVTIAVSHFSTKYIERPARKKLIAAIDQPRWLISAFNWPAASVAFGLALFVYARMLQNQAPADYDPNVYRGAQVLQSGETLGNTGIGFLPTAIAARYDRQEDCIATYAVTSVQKCSFGSPSAPLRIALVGDSHAMQWLPTLLEIIKGRDISVAAYAKASCPFATTDFVLGQENRIYWECDKWHKAAMNELKQSHPDIVLISSINRYALPGVSTIEEINRRVTEGFVHTFQELKEANLRTAVINDTPFLPFDVPDCVASRWKTDCTAPAGDVFKTPEPLLEAARRVPDVGIVDLSDKICPHATCVPVIGNVLVFRDSNHLTALYAKTLADDFYKRLSLPPMTDKLSN
jgi:peptidoglycan/LPS O-acetylase OafA/YrhL